MFLNCFLTFLYLLNTICTFLIASWLNLTTYLLTCPITCVPLMVPHDWICLITCSSVLVTMNSQGIKPIKVTTTKQAQACWFPWIIEGCKWDNMSRIRLLLGLFLVEYFKNILKKFFKKQFLILIIFLYYYFNVYVKYFKIYVIVKSFEIYL
jgi:hypothetical protein